MTIPTQHGIRLRGDGLWLAADAYGPPDAPPILFFHGGGQSRRSWRVAARKVAAAGYRGLTVDLRGHGESDWAGDGDYMLDAFGRDIEALIDGFDQPVVLVGASRGGQAALVGGSRRPGRVRLMMLADVAPKLHDRAIDEFRDFFQVSAGGFASLEEAADALAVHLGRQRMDDPSSLAKTMRAGDDGRLYWQWDPRTVSPEFLYPPEEAMILEQAAERMRDPVVMVHAELSTIVTEESVARFRELTPQLEVIVARGVGHMFTGDRNDAFADSLLEQLARHPAAG